MLPIIGNAAEHYTAITVAMRNKMDLSLGVAVGCAGRELPEHTLGPRSVNSMLPGHAIRALSDPG